MAEELLLFSQGNATWFHPQYAINESGLISDVSSLLPEKNKVERVVAAKCILSVAAAVLKQGHGGTLLVVPKPPDGLQPNRRYEVDQAFRSVLADAAQTHFEKSRKHIPLNAETAAKIEFIYSEKRDAEQRLRSVLTFMGKLSAVDGALVINTDLELIAFGAMIRLAPQDEQVRVDIQPFDPANLRAPLQPESLQEYPGGARHKSALSFAYANPGSLVFVASQDGILSFFTRHAPDGVIRALRPFHPETDLMR